MLISISDVEKSQNMVADMAYNTLGTEISKGYGVIEETNNGVASYSEWIMSGKKDGEYVSYSRTSNEDSWNKQTGSAKYSINPDYMALLDILYSMEDDLNVEEKDNSYVLTLRSQNVDVISLFKNEFNLS